MRSLPLGNESTFSIISKLIISARLQRKKEALSSRSSNAFRDF
ncbi:MAG: hypothetical protein ACI9XB_003264 [Gammaproteobacteria bacterium]